jgi:hypothetical protein
MQDSLCECSLSIGSFPDRTTGVEARLLSSCFAAFLRVTTGSRLPCPSTVTQSLAVMIDEMDYKQQRSIRRVFLLRY